MTLHLLSPERRTLHGTLDPRLEPALTLEPGERVRFVNTLDVAWGMGQHGEPPQPRPKWGPRDPKRDAGIALHGPVAVRGALPGDTLVVHIEQVRTGRWGWTFAGHHPYVSPWLDALDIPRDGWGLLRWDLDPDAGTATSERGHILDLRPFPGFLGLCPGDAGPYDTYLPTQHGGNLDCAELREGTTLYLPVAVPGALLSAGDGHARQGHGEVAGSAIECPLEALELRVELERPATPCRALRARTPDAWITFGFDASLDGAAAQAMGHMLDLLTERLAIPRRDALLLASPLVDLRITQVVNGTRGVHAALPHGALDLI